MQWKSKGKVERQSEDICSKEVTTDELGGTTKTVTGKTLHEPPICMTGNGVSDIYILLEIYYELESTSSYNL